MKWPVLLLLAACGSPAMNDMGADAGSNSGSGSGSNSGSNSGSGSGSGSGSTGTSSLYPIAVGDSWTFNVAAVGAGSTCSPGTYTQAVQSANATGGRAAFQMTDFCTGITGTYDYSLPGGDEVDFYYDSSWAVLVDPMLVDGHSWTYFNTSYTWKRETSVSVPAGTYDDCWTAQQDVSYTAYMTYCRGVGLVHSYSSDLTGAGWDAQLASSDLK
jgi:hypothetical protein